MVDWESFARTLRSFPPGANQLRPPCCVERLASAELKLGPIPADLRSMLTTFNGGELFINGPPFLTIFGIDHSAGPSPSDWFIDVYTPVWRSAAGRDFDWAVAMTNYGGLIVLGPDNMVCEWDVSQGKWDGQALDLVKWTQKVLIEGAAFFNEDD
jgi:hypothetical protein